MIKEKLTYPVASDRAVARIGMMVCFVGACVIPVLVLRKFAALELSEVQLLLGVLATMSTALLLTGIGLLLELKAKAT